MKILALDISSRTGWAVLERTAGLPPSLKEFGLIELGKTILAHGSYPWCYVHAARSQRRQILNLIHRVRPDVIVVEETNLGKNRYSQKMLEFLHCEFLGVLLDDNPPSVYYINSSAWRKALDMSLSSEDRKNNGKLYRAKRRAADTGQKLDKASIGVKGRVGKKHLSVRYANATYNLSLKMKDNDIADAICLGSAYAAGAEICDGQ